MSTIAVPAPNGSPNRLGEILSRILPAEAQPVDPTKIHEFSTDQIAVSPGNRELGAEDVKDLVLSIGSIGQRVPAIVYFSKEEGKFLTGDGTRRLLACRILGIPLRVIVLDSEPTKIELRRIRVAVNNAHKALTPDQLADEIDAHLSDTNCSQQDAAAFFGLSPGYVSKLLSPTKRLIPELFGLCGHPGISRDVIRVLSSVPPEKQKELADRILADVKLHDRAKRDVIAGYAAELRPAKKGRKSAYLPLKGNGFEVKLFNVEGAKVLGDRLMIALKKKPNDLDEFIRAFPSP